jgi:hypothetical protein
MGEAKRRGSFEARKEQAIAEGRIKGTKRKAIIMPALGRYFSRKGNASVDTLTLLGLFASRIGSKRRKVFT